MNYHRDLRDDVKGSNIILEGYWGVNRNEPIYHLEENTGYKIKFDIKQFKLYTEAFNHLTGLDKEINDLETMGYRR